MYIIGSITFNVLARKALENTVRTLSDNVSQLELSYLNNSNQIDKSYALAKGFVDVDHNIFATRTLRLVSLYANKLHIVPITNKDSLRIRFSFCLYTYRQTFSCTDCA